METEYPKVKRACRDVTEAVDVPDDPVGVILGSGLGSFVDVVNVNDRLDYEDITNFASSGVDGHNGSLVFGDVAGTDVIVMDGRVHYYEVQEMGPVVRPTRVLAELGVDTLVVTNAAGGINRDFSPGDLMILEDHLNLMGTNPLMGHHDPEFGPRFPDMSTPYSEDLRSQFRTIVESSDDLTVRKGVYAAMTGPSYETPAEVSMLDTLGADAVGMSTVPETIVANQMGLDVLGVSTITNHAAGVTGEPLSHTEVKEVANEIEEPVNEVMVEFLSNF